MFKPWYDDEKEEGEYFFAPMYRMTVKSKKTGKKSTKRVYQGNPIYDLENDLDSKSMFGDMFNHRQINMGNEIRYLCSRVDDNCI